MIEEATVGWLKALIALLYLYGVRISEALQLRPDDFSFENKKWFVCRVRMSTKRKTSGPIEPTRILRVNYRKESLKSFIPPLLKYLADRMKRFPEKPLWTWDRTTVWKKIKELNSSCSPQLFRHARLHRLAEKGATAAVLRDWAGWSDLRPASNYLDTSRQLAKKYADMIE